MIKLWQLKQRQGLPLDIKEKLSIKRIREFYNEMDGDVYVAFSGGKDSTVLLDLVRRIYPDVPAVFCDTGLEYPEVKEFIKTVDNVTTIRPVISFHEVLDKYGYPVISKRVAIQTRVCQNPTPNNIKTRNLYLNGMRSDGKESMSWKIPNKWRKLIDAPFKVSEQCCYYMKKKPFKDYQKKTGLYPYLGTMASNSESRQSNYLRYGCNIIDGTRIRSSPLGFWLTEDIWNYIHKYNIPYCKIYDMGVRQTGCIFCMFGVHMNNPNRFQTLKKTHPKLWEYCIYKLGLKEVLEYIGVEYE